MRENHHYNTHNKTYHFRLVTTDHSPALGTEPTESREATKDTEATESGEANNSAEPADWQ